MLIAGLPSVCAAESVTVWDLRNQEKIEGWNVNNLTNVQLLPQGLTISTQTTGQLIKTSNIKHKVDKIGVTYTSITGVDAIFFWRPKGWTGDEVAQIRWRLDPATQPTKVGLEDLSNIPEWDSQADRIGFVISENSQFVLQQMEFIGPELTGGMLFALKTFFQFDELRPYSINFLWGPLMTFSQTQFDNLFAQMPPSGTSWNKPLYIILVIGTLIIVSLGLVLKKRIVSPLLIFLFTLWIIYDLRMGAEFHTYAKRDIDTWWSQDTENKRFRERGMFSAFAKAAAPLLAEEDQYVFLALQGWPFWGTIKYEAYPALPTSYETKDDSVDTWVIYRSDVTLDAEGRLVLDGNPISKPGSILMEFAPGAFLFTEDS